MVLSLYVYIFYRVLYLIQLTFNYKKNKPNH